MAGPADGFLPGKLAVRCALVNINAGLFLRFQFNPSAVTRQKQVNYNVENVAGWDHPDILWESGGVKEVRFDAMFDKTQGAADSGFTLAGTTLIGTDAVSAIIESFLYPQDDVNVRHLALRQFLPSRSKFRPPPDGILVMGPRFYRVRLQGGDDMREVLFDKLLTPLRLLTSFKFYVIEEGKINDFNTVSRQAMARLGGVLSAVDGIVTDVGSFFTP